MSFRCKIFIIKAADEILLIFYTDIRSPLLRRFVPTGAAVFLSFCHEDAALYFFADLFIIFDNNRIQNTDARGVALTTSLDLTYDLSDIFYK